MAGGLPSSDITYVLPEAESAICFALPLDKEKIRAYLRKDLPNGRLNHEEDNLDVNRKANSIAEECADWLKTKGYEAVRVIANLKYREDDQNWRIMMHPEVSLRYVAVRSGVASFGWSGNVGMKDYGTAIILGLVVTSAKLKPTEPIPSEEEFCTKCKLCVEVCPFRMFSKDEESSVTLGGRTFTYGKRIDLKRCMIGCGGFTGLDKTGKWSTWSPGRYEYPEDDVELNHVFPLVIGVQKKRPKIADGGGGFIDAKVDESFTVQFTCGNCQYICGGNPKETAERYRLLTNSGCVLQKENGEIYVLPPEQAKEEFAKMPSKRKRLYYRDYKKRIKR